MRQRLLLLLPLALLLAPFLIWPAMEGVIATFTSVESPPLSVHFVSFRNYIVMLGDPETHAAFRNILIIALVGVPAELVLGLATAYVLRRPFPGRGFIRICLLVPWLVSPVAAGVMWRFLFSSTVGIVNFWVSELGFPLLPSPLGLHRWTLPAVILVEIWRKAPLATFLLVPGVQVIPEDLLEQVRIDGGALGSQLRHVLIPWLRPLMLTIAFLLIGDTLGVFDTVLTMTGGGPGSETLVPSLYSYLLVFIAHDPRTGGALAWLVSGVVLLTGALYLVLVHSEDAEETA